VINLHFARPFTAILWIGFFLLLGCNVFSGEKGPTIVVKKDERRIAGIGTNGISRWTSSVARDDEEVTAVNQSGSTAMVSVTNKKTGKTRILNYDAEKGILRFSQSVN
jgi:hypothetical protein